MSEKNKNENIKKIPHFVNNPKINAATAPELILYRPKISYWKAGLYVLFHFIVAFFISTVWVWFEYGNIYSLLENIGMKISIVVFLLFMITLRFSLIWFVRVYQHYAKSETRLRCCMIPSCSEYAILALKKYGALWGGIKIWRRLHRCHPPGGVDYP